MATWALIDGNNVTDVWTNKPTDLIHPDLLALCEQVPSTVKPGDVRNPSDNTFSTPTVSSGSAQPDIRMISRGAFMGLLTSAERKALKEIIKTDDDIADFYECFDYGDPKITDTEFQADIDNLETKSIISTATKTKINDYGKEPS